MKRLGKKKRENTRTFTMSSDNNYFLDEMERVFRTIEYLCNIGSSREVSIYVDGDGRCDLLFKKIGEEGKPVDLVDTDVDTNKHKITFDLN